MKKTLTVKQKPAMKRVWFNEDGELVDGNRAPCGEMERVFDACKRLGLLPVQSFDPWNENDGAMGLALDRKNNPVLIGGEPFMQKVTLPDALLFLADMCYEASGGEDGDNKADFFKLVAAQLERRSR